MDSSSQDEFKPKIGMEFDSLDEAWIYWIEYGRKFGFGVRKHYFSKSKKTGFITSYKYVCCKEGIRKEDKRDTFPLNPRLETRTNCKVRMGIRYVNSKYRVYDFVECHNHPLHIPETVHMLASQRKVTDDLASDRDQDVKHTSHALFSTIFLMESSSQDQFKPKIGMEFDSLDEAWIYWIEYGRKSGFGVRKHYFSKSKKTGFITSYKYVCFKEGIRKEDKRDTFPLNPRLETRTNCKVRMGIKHVNSKYRVCDFVDCHNHPLHLPETVHMLASQRKVTDDMVSDGDQNVKYTGHALFSAMAKKGNSNCETSRKRHKVEGLLSKLKDTATKPDGKSVDDTVESEDQSWNLEVEGQVANAKAYGRSKDDAANISSHGSQQIFKTKGKAPTNMSIRNRLLSIHDADGRPQHNLAVTLIDGLPQSISIPAGGARLQESVPSSSLHETPATEEPTEGLATSLDRRALAGMSYMEKFKLLSTYLAQATGVLSDVISDLRVSHSKGELEVLRNEHHATLIRKKQLGFFVNKLTEEAEVARATHESLMNKIRALEAGNKKAEDQLTLVATRYSEAWQEGFNEGLKRFPCTEQGQAHLHQLCKEEKAKFLKSSEFLDHIQYGAFQYLNYGFDTAVYQAQEQGFTGLFDKDAAIDNAPELEGRDPRPSA